MRLTTRSRYGTKIVLDIALMGNEGPVRVRDISLRHGVSEKYLAKLIQELRKARIIESKRGPRGGHVLIRPLEGLTVGEIVRVLEEDPAQRPHEVGESGEGDVAKCVHRRIWSSVDRAMNDALEAMTFAQLVQDVLSCPRADCCLKSHPAHDREPDRE